MEKLGKYAKVEGGYAFKSSEFVKEGVPIIRISNFDGGVVNLTKCVKYPAKDFDKYQRYEVKEGDILMAMSGATTGKVGVLKGLNDRCWLNQRVGNFKILNKDKLFKKYLYYIITSKDYQRKLINIASGCAQPNISAKQLESIEVNIPNIETQKKIVSFLDKIRDAKEWRKKADDLTKDFLKSVFLEMFGDRNKFEQVTLNDVANLSMGGTPSTKEKSYWEAGTINWMKSGDIKGNYIYSIPQMITELGHKKSNTTIFPKDTVVIALNGQGKTRGTTAILKVETTSNQSVVGIMIDKNKISSEYLHYNLKTRYSEIRNLTGDSDRSGLNLSILRSFKIILPPITLQNKFASIVKEVEAMKEQQKHSKNKIDNLFNALMQKAFKGELLI